jgi:hypothetical protein
MLLHTLLIHDMDLSDNSSILVFRIEFMYEAHYMMISYRPELCGIW